MFSLFISDPGEEKMSYVIKSTCPNCNTYHHIYTDEEEDIYTCDSVLCDDCKEEARGHISNCKERNCTKCNFWRNV